MHTPAAATPSPLMGLAATAEDDGVEFLGFESVLQEAENLMRDEGESDWQR